MRQRRRRTLARRRQVKRVTPGLPCRLPKTIRQVGVVEVAAEASEEAQVSEPAQECVPSVPEAAEALQLADCVQRLPELVRGL